MIFLKESTGSFNRKNLWGDTLADANTYVLTNTIQEGSTFEDSYGNMYLWSGVAWVEWKMVYKDFGVIIDASSVASNATNSSAVIDLSKFIDCNLEFIIESGDGTKKISMGFSGSSNNLILPYVSNLTTDFVSNSTKYPIHYHSKSIVSTAFGVTRFFKAYLKNSDTVTQTVMKLSLIAYKGRCSCG